MSQMILPGVYITVRDEGLITVGGISVGHLGIVGTAETGEDNKVEVLSSFTQAKEKFGESSEGLTLIKSLELMFGNGARTVYAVKTSADTETAHKDALAFLENEIVNIVLIAGKDAGSFASDILKTHIKITSAIKRERIAIIGCDASTDHEVIKSGKTGVTDDTGRIVYTGPGITFKKRDPRTGDVTEEILSGAYTACAFAGLLASLPVRVSPTNKVLNISGLAAEFNHGQLEALVDGGVLTVEKREGFRIVKGITTSKNTAWAQITTRRIVDKAIFGVRKACNPYIGKLNNDRVRGAMKATIDGFLTRMVEEESLTAYTLEVTATRAQEIAGQCMVNMAIQPTFSIDYIVVTMYLG